MRQIIRMCCFVIIFAPSIRSRDNDEALKLFEDAVEAMGGEAFLNVRDMVSEGNYFQFTRDGASSPLIKFKDYTKLPDKSRNEMGNKKKELVITIFDLGKNEGWIQEGEKEPRAATPEEMREFHNVAKHSLDLIFRTRYKDPENRIFHIGPGEGRDVTLERVKLIDPENDEVTVYFDRMSRLPAKLEYSAKDERGVRVRITQEFSQWHWIQGVRTSLRNDVYVNGRPSSQSHINTIEYNTETPDSFFSEPVPPE